MSRKRVRRELLRALVLAALLSTPYMGAGAVDIDEPITGDTISGEYNLHGRTSLFDFEPENEEDDIVV